jgi:hypothetical protein
MSKQEKSPAAAAADACNALCWTQQQLQTFVQSNSTANICAAFHGTAGASQAAVLEYLHIVRAAALLSASSALCPAAEALHRALQAAAAAQE